jgi:hypothetical protein
MKLENLRQFFAGCLFGLAACAAPAEPYFVNNKGDEVWDKATDLIWARCSVGQIWSGSTCKGDAKRFRFDEAQRQVDTGGKGWTIPTVLQLSSLRLCPSGLKQETRHIRGEGASLSVGCVKDSLALSIDPKAFPATETEYAYWTSSVEDRNSNPSQYQASLLAWAVGFYNGEISAVDGETRKYIRLVRASQISGAKAGALFSKAVSSPTKGEFEDHSKRAATVAESRQEAYARERERQRQGNQYNASSPNRQGVASISRNEIVKGGYIVRCNNGNAGNVIVDSSTCASPLHAATLCRANWPVSAAAEFICQN